MQGMTFFHFLILFYFFQPLKDCLFRRPGSETLTVKPLAASGIVSQILIASAYAAAA